MGPYGTPEPLTYREAIEQQARAQQLESAMSLYAQLGMLPPKSLLRKDDLMDLAAMLRKGDRLTMELHDDGTWSFELQNDYAPVYGTKRYQVLEDAAKDLVVGLRGGATT